ncbi:Rad17p KNAG_0E00180 [Huiozyma naganishii CBS 8797]|uniref:DNA damage checkpoint control protein RAD17 n=1 Tax=Huiozyma naganishii (strain ATCC MYA-139 / BCRC 22969 / CBS 8797 / KCTC 17520 / NBRC 10181 / NCYC 3082 / Yp74L-3) TaxID=1071383 RepID=J7S7E5_HUIN7|nr:hypothetical protein KNAG_0E00180 [Kazachstania naganishii CBS 8797]CCK70286.1 hypothetical protein KNAG_0E00180 [Kazachstania naganishii CBS 8797]
MGTFVASTVHLEHFTTALNCLTPFGLKDDVLIYIDRDGLSFVRENNHVIKIQLLLSKELFTSYQYPDEEEFGDERVDADGDLQSCMKLCVKINHLLDSVNIMSKNVDDIVECTLTYDGHGSPFILIFEDSFIEERVEYSTLLFNDFDSNVNGLQLAKDEIVFECIIKGDTLYNALKELKEIGCKQCYLYAKTSETGHESVFAIIAKSDLGFSKIILPNNRSIIEKLEIYKGDSTTLLYDTPVVGFFDFNSIDKIRLSVKIASKVLFRMDAQQVLSVNILSQTEDVLVSKPRNDPATNNTTVKQPQLPRDYPGIVIEICMFAKEALDSLAQQDIELLMETTNTKKNREINYISSRTTMEDKPFAPNHNAETHSESDTDEELHITNSVPLFF